MSLWSSMIITRQCNFVQIEMAAIQEKIFAFIEEGSETSGKERFNSLALEVFRFQYENCKPYREFVSLLGTDIEAVDSPEKIPFLPIRFFKSRDVYSATREPEKLFTSSATTGMVPSRHPVADLSLYELSFTKAFGHFYGNPGEYTILALLPSYLEREGSSLVYMADRLINLSGSGHSGFYLYNFEELRTKLEILKKERKKTLLIGVSFALLDFVKDYPVDFPELTVMETGGMKGRGIELPREELHRILMNGFGVKAIHSEYGMAELLSQAYSAGDGIFATPHWMNVYTRDLSNPLKVTPAPGRGGLNVTDLANVNSCSFIETEDLVIKETGNLFRIPGRINNSELRGCNLLLG